MATQVMQEVVPRELLKLCTKAGGAPTRLRVPLRVHVSIGPSWADLKRVAAA